MEEVHVPSPESCVTLVERVNVTIEKGMMHGDRAPYPFMASQLPKRIPGDLLVAVRVRQHVIFKRIGNDLILNVDISLLEALVGFQREVVHLDGHLVRFGVPRGVVLRPGVVLEIENEGMPLREDPSSFGRLIVTFNIRFPDRITPVVATELE